MTPISEARRTSVLLHEGTAMPIAEYPRPRIYPIVRKAGAGALRRSVGFVMVGGSVEQFDAAVRQHRLLAQENGFLRGPCIHAQEGTIDF